MAARLGELFGNGPTIWTMVQAEYEDWCAFKAIDVSDIPATVETS